MSVDQSEEGPVPGDLLAVMVAVALTGVAVFVAPINSTFIRPITAVGFVIFVPGYVVVAAAFPAAHDSAADSGDAAGHTQSLDVLSRLVFSFGTSIAIVTLTGIALGATAWGIGQQSVFAALAAITILTVPVALYRRQRLPPQDRLRLFNDPKRTIQDVRGTVFRADSAGEAALNVGIVAVLVLAVLVGVGLAPPQEEGITEFYLLSEGDDGTYDADDYPAALARGERHSFLVGVGNAEYQPLDYTVVIKLQKLGPENRTVEQERELQRFTATIDHNRTRRFEHSVAPELTGDNIRLVYLLYTGSPPENPQISNAYRELHLWLTVESDPT